MGHKPSAIAEGYRPRSIDALRPYLALIEQFVLDKAGVFFDAERAALRRLAGHFRQLRRISVLPQLGPRTEKRDAFTRLLGLPMKDA